MHLAQYSLRQLVPRPTTVPIPAGPPNHRRLTINPTTGARSSCRDPSGLSPNIIPLSLHRTAAVRGDVAATHNRQFARDDTAMETVHRTDAAGNYAAAICSDEYAQNNTRKGVTKTTRLAVVLLAIAATGLAMHAMGTAITRNPVMAVVIWAVPSTASLVRWSLWPVDGSRPLWQWSVGLSNRRKRPGPLSHL